MSTQHTLAGPDAAFKMYGYSGASVTGGVVSGTQALGGCKFNAFSIGVTQSTMEATGFGDQDAEVRGGVKRATITASGITTAGTVNDDFGIATMTQQAGALLLTFISGCTLAMLAVMSGIGATVQLEAFDQSTYSFVKSGPLTETSTWPTT